MQIIKVLPQGAKVEIQDGQSLFAGLKAAGFHINSTCGGCASCGRCVVHIIEGEQWLNDIPFEEKQLLGNVFHITKERLSCQTTTKGPVTVDISMHESGSEKTKRSNIRRRSKEQVKKIEEEREEERRERRKDRPKRLGGGRKPKAFDYRDED